MWWFLFKQLYPEDNSSDPDHYPTISSKISVFNSAIATFYAPSDDSGICGMHHEHLYSTSSWHRWGPRQDTALVVEDQSKPGMQGLWVVRIKLLFSFSFEGVDYPCALIEWFQTIDNHPDSDTGLWKVKLDMTHGEHNMSMLHLDMFLCGAHLLPVFGDHPLPQNFHNSFTLDLFHTYFVNNFIDHASHEMVF